MNGVVRKTKYISSFITSNSRFYRIWTYGEQEKKLQTLPFHTQDSVVSGGCGFFVTYKQYQSTISLHCVDSLLSLNNERDNDTIPCTVKLYLPDGKKVKTIFCGRNHIIALDRDGLVFSYGINTLGQCGVVDQKKTYISKFSMVTINSEWQITKVACGLDHNLFLNRYGQVFACGWSADGQTGTGLSIVNEPKAVCGDINNHVVTDIYCGANTSFAITGSHMVYAWGNNEYGQLAIHNKDPQITVPQLIDISAIKNDTIVDIAPGDSFTAFLLKSGQVFTCGSLGQTLPSYQSHLQCFHTSGDVIQSGLHYGLINNNKDYLLFGSFADKQNTPSQVLFPCDIISLSTAPDVIYGIRS